MGFNLLIGHETEDL